VLDLGAKAGPFTDDPAAAVLRERTDKLALDVADLLPQREGIDPERRDLPAVHDLLFPVTGRTGRGRPFTHRCGRCVPLG
jgi:hypothetical protein